MDKDIKYMFGVPEIKIAVPDSACRYYEASGSDNGEHCCANCRYIKRDDRFPVSNVFLCFNDKTINPAVGFIHNISRKEVSP